jgi:hypothetical protein
MVEGNHPEENANLSLEKSMLWQVWFQNIQQKSCCLTYHVSLLTEAYKTWYATEFLYKDFGKKQCS